MKEILLALSRGENLSEPTAQDAMHQMMSGTASPAQIAAYLTLLQVKGETIEELTGSARAMRDHAIQLVLPYDDVIDTCGTGGDHSGTFNISTAASFVLAAGSIRVAKHGNRAASSLTGSADVLAELGVAIDLTPLQAKRCLDETGFCFLFAQSYHPAMKHVAPIRKELGFRTMFNFLGPLTNPAQPKYQVLGTPSVDVAEKMARVLAALDCQRALVVHAEDGLDELSITGMSHVFEVNEGTVHPYNVTPADFGLKTHPLHAIAGGIPEENAAIIRHVFQGEKGARRDVVVMNAAAGFYVAKKVSSYQEGARLAERLIDEGKAAQKLHEVCVFSQSVAEGLLA